MKSITRIEDAYKLPEKSCFNFTDVPQPDGSVMSFPSFRKIVAVKLEEDTILVFEDKDGRTMRIEYDCEGAYKTPVM